MQAPLFPEWTIVIGVIIGAFFGSFLNMAIYRLPRNLSINDPKRSFCPDCKHSLSAVDLVPLLSWMSTGGKCRYCKKPIAFRYQTVEIVTAILFGGVWWRFMAGLPNPDVVSAIAYALAVCCLVAIIFIDWSFYIIPDELNAILLVIALVYSGVTGRVVPALEGALLGWGLLWGIQLLGRLFFGKDAMGDGDIKMMRGIGALLGPLLLLANVGIAVVLGIIGGVAGIIIAKRSAEPESAESDVPYEPTPVWVVLVAGVWYLLCLDVVALVIKPLDRWITSKLPQEVVEEDDDWAPSATTIPFGPYLAAGAILCMLFGVVIESGMKTYWNHETGAQPVSQNILRSGSTIFAETSSQDSSWFRPGIRYPQIP